MKERHHLACQTSFMTPLRPLTAFDVGALRWIGRFYRADRAFLYHWGRESGIQPFKTQNTYRELYSENNWTDLYTETLGTTVSGVSASIVG